MNLSLADDYVQMLMLELRLANLYLATPGLAELDSSDISLLLITR